MSILTAEFDLEKAKRVYGDERVEEKAFEIARNALRKNMLIEDIVEITGLTLDEVENLRASIGR